MRWKDGRMEEELEGMSQKRPTSQEFQSLRHWRQGTLVFSSRRGRSSSFGQTSRFTRLIDFSSIRSLVDFGCISSSLVWWKIFWLVAESRQPLATSRLLLLLLLRLDVFDVFVVDRVGKKEKRKRETMEGMIRSRFNTPHLVRLLFFAHSFEPIRLASTLALVERVGSA